MLSTLYTIVVVALLFGVTVFVHELGHFLVARRLGLMAEVFSIGFGPAIWKKRYKGVLYKVGILPLGGYVALPQMDPGGPQRQDAQGRPLPSVPPWKKILVALSGVTGNLVLAVVIAYVVYWGGKSYAPAEENSIVGFVATNSVAYAKGLRIGDTIERVNGKPVDNWEEFVLQTALSETVVVEASGRDGTAKKMTLPTETFLGTPMVPGISPLNYCYVLDVQPGSSAEEAGLQSGDKIVSFDGVRIYSREHLIRLVDRYGGQTAPLTIERNGKTLQVQARPQYNESLQRAVIGITFNTLDVKKPWAQLRSHGMLIFRLLRALVTPKESKAAAQAVGGPIAIFAVFWLMVQSSLIAALWFTGLLNVNLAVINLLPIPILDGGHIVFALIELVTRRPLSPRLVSAVSNLFAILLIALFIVLSYRDAVRFWPQNGSSGEQPAAPGRTTNGPPAGAPASNGG